MIQGTFSFMVPQFSTAYPKPRHDRIEVDNGHLTYLTPIEFLQS